MKCEQIDLDDLLNADDHVEAYREDVTRHLESCQICQSRLADLAANMQQWEAAQHWLSCESQQENSQAKELYVESITARQRWRLPVVWDAAMAQSMLSAASHPEMLGRIGRYDVERLIGSGGMGVVFKAHDTELNRPVAIKLLAPYLATGQRARDRFSREARAAAAVVDDHVVPIHNVETAGEHPFLVMKYIAGGSLQQRLDREGPLETCEVLRLGTQIAKGLAAAHAQGLIHRDVKPANILLDEGVDRALLTDFGLAHASDEVTLTRSGFHPGTPHYMSPEQVRGESIDARSDLFGLGCALYSLCTGHPPFRSSTSYAVLRRIIEETPCSIREINPKIPDWLEQVVMKLLAKKPNDRFDSAEQVAEILEGCLAHVQQPSSTPLPASVRQWSRPHAKSWHLKSRFGTGTFVILLLLFAAVLVVSEWHQAAPTSGPFEVDEPAHLVTILDGDELILANIPAGAAADPTVTTQSLGKGPRFGADFRTIGAFGGHLIALNERNLVAVDLHSGEIRKITEAPVRNAAMVENELFLVTERSDASIRLGGNALMHIDLATMQSAELCSLAASGDKGSLWNLDDVAIAVSPDGTRVAVTELASADDDQLGDDQAGDPPGARIVLATTDGIVKRPGKVFPNRMHLGGGLQPLMLAPKLVWAHHDLLIIAAGTNADDVGAMPPAGLKQELTSLAFSTEKFRNLCELPDLNPKLNEPWFSRTAAGTTMIHLGSLGQYEINWQARYLKESNALAPQYSLAVVNNSLALKYQDELLEPNAAIERIFVSPDGSRVAWLPTDVGTLPNAPTIVAVQSRRIELKLHDAAGGIRTVAVGNFPRVWQQSQYPLLNTCLWITPSQLTRDKSFDKLAISQDSFAANQIDSRPVVSESVEVGIVTSKQVYLRHDPLEFEITLKNIGDLPIRFETKRLLHGAQPFDIDIKSEHTRQRIELFDDYLNKPQEQYLQLPPGEIVTLTRTVEVDELGKHQLRLRFEKYASWKGAIKVEAEFEVVDQSTPQLLQAKFDRLIAKCQRQYAKSPEFVTPNVFWPLGPAAEPLLIQYLRDCEDGEFRQALANSLAPIASDRSLPYLKQLLDTDLQYDGILLVDCLFKLSELQAELPSPPRSQPATVPSQWLARQLLFAAGEHANVGVRRQVVDGLCHVVSEEVDRFMLRACADSDVAVATMAARYVAARRQMTLEQWFADAGAEITEPNVVAANSIIAELETTWNPNLPKLPSGSAEEIGRDPGKRRQYVAAMQYAEQWCAENPRASDTFFDAIQQKARRSGSVLQVWGKDKSPPPIRIERDGN
ncbi:protein kinase domain-containing protein [Planctomycetaceae bacterium SH139]